LTVGCRGVGFVGASAAGFGGMVTSLTCPRLDFAQNKKSLQFKLPWVAEGSNRFTFVAKGMGFLEKHGRDVDVAHGSGPVAAAQAIGEGRFDFGMATPPRGCRRQMTAALGARRSRI
jgi:ABC-type nitrate/sulfonate/bicarbonate transport system substrate-binding protein